MMTKLKLNIKRVLNEVNFAVHYIHMTVVQLSSLIGQWMVDELNEDS